MLLQNIHLLLQRLLPIRTHLHLLRILQQHYCTSHGHLLHLEQILFLLRRHFHRLHQTVHYYAHCCRIHRHHHLEMGIITIKIKLNERPDKNISFCSFLLLLNSPVSDVLLRRFNSRLRYDLMTFYKFKQYKSLLDSYYVVMQYININFNLYIPHIFFFNYNKDLY